MDAQLAALAQRGRERDLGADEELLKTLTEFSSFLLTKTKVRRLFD